MRAWATLLSETEDIAKQHEVIGETLSNSLVEPAKNLAKDVSAERKKASRSWSLEGLVSCSWQTGMPRFDVTKLIFCFAKFLLLSPPPRARPPSV